ncbi:hypothetical protein Hdeb2414_s0010g00341561 [Helianthus debilis subsp. tardiflorus]
MAARVPTKTPIISLDEKGKEKWHLYYGSGMRSSMFKVEWHFTFFFASGFNLRFFKFCEEWSNLLDTFKQPEHLSFLGTLHPKEGLVNYSTQIIRGYCRIVKLNGHGN